MAPEVDDATPPAKEPAPELPAAGAPAEAPPEEAKGPEAPAPDEPPTPPEAAPPAAPREGRASRAGRFFRDNYLTTDRRLLGIFRIYFGCLLFIDIVRRLPDLTFFYTADGSLSNHFALFAPMARPSFSLFFSFTTRAEATIAFLLTALVYFFYIIGWRTRIWQILAVVLHASLNSRNIFVENGGCVSTVILATWAAFLPLGDRFSVDALLRSYRARNERKPSALNERAAISPPENRHVTLIVLALLIQVSAVYFFNCVQKTDIAWRKGETIHWVLWQNRIATWLCSVIREHEPSWLSPAFTWGTLVIEGAAPALVLTPFFTKGCRSVHVFLIIGMHAVISALMTLGPFSYTMIGLNFLILPVFWMDKGAAWLRKGKVRRTVAYEPADAGLHALARLLARLDSFELLTFRDRSALAAEDGAPEGAVLSVKDEATGQWQSGAAALTGALRSIPVGWLFAPLFRLCFARRAALADLLRLAPGVPEDENGPAAVEAPPPAPLRRSLGRGRVTARELFAAVMLFTMVAQVFKDNWWLRGKIPDKLRAGPPAVLEPVVLYPRLLQGWSMFANAPREDGTIVVDGVTADGRHIDVFTGAAPDFEAPLHGPWYQSQLWCDYFLKIHFDGHRGYREELKRYISNWQRLEGRPPEDRIVSFDVYWVSCNSPGYPYKSGDQPYNIRKTVIASSSGK